MDVCLLVLTLLVFLLLLLLCVCCRACILHLPAPIQVAPWLAALDITLLPVL